MAKEESGYETTLDRIEKERRERTGTIDIGKLGLTKIRPKSSPSPTFASSIWEGISPTITEAGR